MGLLGTGLSSQVSSLAGMPFMITAWQADLVAMVGGATTKAAESRPGIAWCSDVRRATVSFPSDRIGTAAADGEPR